jgi:hypothetical protein
MMLRYAAAVLLVLGFVAGPTQAAFTFSATDDHVITGFTGLTVDGQTYI